MHLGTSYLNKLRKTFALPDPAGLKPGLGTPGTQDATRVPEEASMVHIVEVGSVPFFWVWSTSLHNSSCRMSLRFLHVNTTIQWAMPRSGKICFCEDFQIRIKSKHVKLKLCMREVAHAHEPAPECPSSMCEARFNLWFPLYQEEHTFGSWVVGMKPFWIHHAALSGPERPCAFPS